MVKSILDNDPFYIDAIDTNNVRNLKNTKLLNNTLKTIETDGICKLKTAKSAQVMSAEFPNLYCGCHICNIYKREIFLSDKFSHIPPLHLLNRAQTKYHSAHFTDNESDIVDCEMPSTSNLQSETVTSNYTEDKLQPLNSSEQIVKSIQNNYRSKAISLFKYIDSMKISILNISLNNAGNRKALASGVNSKYRLPTSISQSYFVEYNVPDCLTNGLTRSNSKVDSGLTSNLFRVCSKKLQNEEICFKHTSTHDIVNLQQVNLSAIELKFQISTRAMKQKRSNILGYAVFNMKHLPIMSDDFVLGTIKVTVQLGCGRLYFGKEFVEFIETNRKNSVSTVTQKTDVTLDTPSSQTVNSVIFQPNKPKEIYSPTNKVSKSLNSDRSVPKSVVEGSIINKEKFADNEGGPSSFSTLRSNLKGLVENFGYSEESHQTGTIDVNDSHQKTILYGLIYVSEAKYFEGPINSYFSCQAFCLGDTLCSRVVYNSKDPVFNFYQKVPLIYDNSFLNYLRDNTIIIDFWERYENDDIAIGTSQLSLYQFYVTYRNTVITNTLIQNLDGKLYGQMKVLVAIGTATQIKNLEVERGIKGESLSVTYVPIVPEVKKKENIEVPSINSKSSSLSFKKPDYLKAKNRPVNEKAINPVGSNDSKKRTSNIQKDVLDALLTQLVDQKRKNDLVETATNTDPSVIKDSNKKDNIHNVHLDDTKYSTNHEVKKTTDLLDYLNGALAFENKVVNSHSTSSNLVKEDDDRFKAHILIEGALHLPSRRKCKVKKNKKKNIMYEDSLPSTYVSFETVPGSELKYTNIVPQSSNPQWDYESDVLLPVDILINNQKRLIFKVWRKGNVNSSQPNIETDVILGFAALDLTVLLAGLPSVQGWFNIIDFSSKCNGQIKIHVTPLENILKFSESKTAYNPKGSSELLNMKPIKSVISAKLELQEPPGELLRRALKRKFTELEEITQRLRSRLADVTKDDSDTSNDDFVDEFERDINTLSIEEDYDMLDLKSLSESNNLELRSFSQIENGANNFLLKKANDHETSIYSKGILHGESFSKGGLSDSAYSSTKAGCNESVTSEEELTTESIEEINLMAKKNKQTLVPVKIFLVNALTIALAGAVSLKLEPFQLDEFLHGTFGDRGWNGSWISDTTVLYEDASRNIYLFDVNQHTSKLFLNRSVFNDYAGSSISFYDNLRYALLKYNTTFVFRHSETAQYTVYSIENGQFYDVHGKKHLQLVQWAPKNGALAYVYENNIYYVSNVNKITTPRQITNNGVSGIIYNGIPDWVYEEEVLGSGSALWFSPDGSHLAFAQFNDTKVKDFHYFIYGQSYDQYPTVVTLKYPKVNTTNPLVEVKYVNLNNPKSTVFNLKKAIPTRIVSEDYIIQDIKWANNTDIVVVSLNRVQNVAAIVRCNIYSRACSYIYTYKATKGWIDLKSPIFNSDGSNYLMITSENQENDSYKHLSLLENSDFAKRKRLTFGKRVVDLVYGWDEIRNLVTSVKLASRYDVSIPATNDDVRLSGCDS
ncbi:hypothetical protein RN001_008946 [Aquatica leii]|uniref:C2 domain-containing protein n=1 Tax=Aquatica leii TaxID=1421715 RepID=A0AAN7SRK0_9COLE|nr:hypothetical protein RN001_008946 [Aquatica leii]